MSVSFPISQVIRSLPSHVFPNKPNLYCFKIQVFSLLAWELLDFFLCFFSHLFSFRAWPWWGLKRMNGAIYRKESKVELKDNVYQGITKLEVGELWRKIHGERLLMMFCLRHHFYHLVDSKKRKKKLWNFSCCSQG